MNLAAGSHQAQDTIPSVLARGLRRGEADHASPGEQEDSAEGAHRIRSVALATTTSSEGHALCIIHTSWVCVRERAFA